MGLGMRILERVGLHVGPHHAARLACALRPGDRNLRYDRATFEIMRRTADRRGAWIDVGAHAGEMTAAMRYFVPDRPIYAFEPIPALHQKLRDRFFDDPRVCISSVALSDSPGMTTFEHVVSNPAYSGLQRRTYDRPNETVATIEVTTARLDDIIAPAERVAFVKVDVEGAELLVFRGGLRTLKRDRPVVVFEHGRGGADCYGHTPADVFEVLTEGAGLRVSRLDDWLADRPSLSRDALVRSFEQGLEWYYVAHP